MMTPRGVADVNVYTPERVEARYGIRPEQIPDFIGLKGDTTDNIPGIPGIGDKTAGQLIAQYGSLEAVIEHADELSPARAKNITEHADQARVAKELATMRRDLDIDCDPAELVLAPPDRSRAEGDLPPLRVPRPALARRHARRGAAGRADGGHRRRGAVARGLSSRSSGRVGFAGDATTAPPSRTRTASSSGRGRRRVEGELVVHDAKALRVDAADDTLLAAYLIEPGRSTYELADLAAEYGVELAPDAGDRGGDGRARRRAPRRRAGSSTRCSRGSRSAARRRSTARSSCRSRACSPRWRRAGVKIDTYRMGEITARLAERVAELEARAYELAGEEFMLGSTQQVARILFEKLGLDRRAARARPATRPTRRCCARSATSTSSCR